MIGSLGNIVQFSKPQIFSHITSCIALHSYHLRHCHLAVAIRSKKPKKKMCFTRWLYCLSYFCWISLGGNKLPECQWLFRMCLVQILLFDLKPEKKAYINQGPWDLCHVLLPWCSCFSLLMCFFSFCSGRSLMIINCYKSWIWPTCRTAACHLGWKWSLIRHRIGWDSWRFGKWWASGVSIWVFPKIMVSPNHPF